LRLEKSTMKYKYIFFDLDHTLWDYHANSTKALIQVYNKHKLGSYFNSVDEFVSIYNRYNDELWDAYRQGNIKKEVLRYKRFDLTFREKGLIDLTLPVVIGDLYLEITPRLNTLFPNTVEILEYLVPKGYDLYILTNGFLKTQETKMENAHIDKYFNRIFSSEELGINKPHKEFFHWAVSSIHARKNECLMIGDDENVDIGGAKNYGIDAVWFNPGNNEVSKRAIKTISDLSELKEIL